MRAALAGGEAAHAVEGDARAGRRRGGRRSRARTRGAGSRRRRWPPTRQDDHGPGRRSGQAQHADDQEEAGSTRTGIPARRKCGPPAMARLRDRRGYPEQDTVARMTPAPTAARDSGPDRPTSATASSCGPRPTATWRPSSTSRSPRSVRPTGRACGPSWREPLRRLGPWSRTRPKARDRVGLGADLSHRLSLEGDHHPRRADRGRGHRPGLPTTGPGPRSSTSHHEGPRAGATWRS